MAIYQQTVNEIKAAAQAVNPHGRFDHGRHVDLSQDFDKEFPVIWLLPWKLRDPEQSGFLYTHPLIVLFFDADKPESSNEERKEIIHRMEVLKDSFMAKLRELNKKHDIANVISEPQYQTLQPTASGFAVSFNYRNYDPCQ